MTYLAISTIVFVVAIAFFTGMVVALFLSQRRMMKLLNDKKY